MGLPHTQHIGINNSDPYASLVTLGMLANVRVEWNDGVSEGDLRSMPEPQPATPKQAPAYYYRAIAIAVLTLLLTVGVALAFALFFVGSMAAPIGVPIAICAVMAGLGATLAYEDVGRYRLYHAVDECVRAFENPSDAVQFEEEKVIEVSEPQRNGIAWLKKHGYTAAEFRQFLNGYFGGDCDDIRPAVKIARLSDWFYHVRMDHDAWARDIVLFFRDEGKLSEIDMGVLLPAVYGVSPNTQAIIHRARPRLSDLINELGRNHSVDTVTERLRAPDPVTRSVSPQSPDAPPTPPLSPDKGSLSAVSKRNMYTEGRTRHLPAHSVFVGSMDRLSA